MKVTHDQKEALREAIPVVEQQLGELRALTCKTDVDLTPERAQAALDNWEAAVVSLTRALKLAAEENAPLQLRAGSFLEQYLSALGDYLGDNLTRTFSLNELRENQVLHAIGGNVTLHDRINQLYVKKILRRDGRGQYSLAQPAIDYLLGK